MGADGHVAAGIGLRVERCVDIADWPVYRQSDAERARKPAGCGVDCCGRPSGVDTVDFVFSSWGIRTRLKTSGGFFMSLDVPLRITSEVRSRAATVTVCGEIDLENVADLRSTLDELVAATDGDIVIDLSEVSYLDSTGLHELLSVRSNAAGLDRRLIVQRPSPAVCRLFELCDVNELFTVSADGDGPITSHPATDAESRPGVDS